jgi:hypothetical protein
VFSNGGDYHKEEKNTKKKQDTCISVLRGIHMRIEQWQ